MASEPFASHFEKSAGTAHQTHRTIRAALNEAVKRGYAPKNPALIAKAPRVEETEVKPFNREEIAKLYKVAAEDGNACRWIIAIALGLRQGEVLGLRWSDVDFDEGTLRVQLQRPRPKWKHGCGGTCGRKHGGHCPQRVNERPETKKPKSKAGTRPIGLPQPLSTGRPINHRTDLKKWKDLLAAAKVRDARLHDARHTAATVLLELGITQRAAQHVMGWSNPSMSKRYQHVTGRVLEMVADKVGEAMETRP